MPQFDNFWEEMQVFLDAIFNHSIINKPVMKKKKKFEIKICIPHLYSGKVWMQVS